MGTTADKLNKLLETKQAIKQAIADKGINITDDTVFADYPSKIASIEVGSGFGDASTYELLWNAITNNNTDYQDLFSYYDGTELDVSSLSTLGTNKVTNMHSMFFNCLTLTSLDLSNLDTSNVTDMSWMFSNCKQLTTLDVSNFNTSNVTDMHDMFYDCNKLTSLDVSNFNTSNVTDMGSMFGSSWNYNEFIELDLSNFITSNVTDMSYMFKYCNKLTTLNISNFDMTNVTNTNYMFQNCSSLHTLRLDNCSNDTIRKIINSKNFPTNTIEGKTREIWCKRTEGTSLESELPNPWVFHYID